MQVMLALAGNALLLGAAGFLLVSSPDSLAPLVRQIGELMGLPGLILAMIAAVIHFRRREGGEHLAGIVALLAVLYHACQLTAIRPDGWFAYRILMIDWALFGLTLAAASWILSRRLSDPRGLQARRLWAVILGCCSILLALRAAPVDPWGPEWSSASVLIVAVLAALLAVWQRREAWALIAGLCVNLAVSLVLCFGGYIESLEKDAVLFIQANAIVAGAVALVWLAAVRWLIPQTDHGLTAAPLLTLQIGLTLAGNAVLLVAPLVWLIARPGNLHPGVSQTGGLGGWIGLLLGLAAAGWHMGLMLTRGGIAVACGMGLALGVQAACSMAAWDSGNWLAYHVLIVVWSVVALALLVIGWRVTRPESEQGCIGSQVNVAASVRRWVGGIGIVVLGLGIRGAVEDPTGPWWPAAAFLLAALLAGVLAIWTRRQELVHVNGVLLTAVGLVIALRLDMRAPADLLYIALLGLAGAAAVWSTLEARLRRRIPPLDLRGQILPFAHVATALPVVVLLAASVLGLVSAWDQQAHAVPLLSSPLGWVTLAVVAIALTACLQDPTARFTLAGMYATGLSALALWLGQVPQELRWTAAPALSLFVTFTTLFWRAVRSRQGFSTAWFPPAQALLTALVTALSLWLCLTGDSAGMRLRGPLAIVLLLPAALLFAAPTAGEGDRLRVLAQYAALLLGALALGETSWAWLDPTSATLWLQRSGLMLAVSSLLTLIYGVGLGQMLPASLGWRERLNQAAGVLGALALALAAAVLVQELLLTQQQLHPLMTPPVQLAVVAGLLLLMAAGLCFAVLPGLDPLGLSEGGRTGYVYAAELLLVALFAHLRLTAPERFGGRLAEHWTFVVLGVAFVGAGLSEFFDRLGLRVLAEPLRRTGLFLPMLPVLAFWMRPAGSYGGLWFGVGLFYALLSVLWRSLALLLLAALAGNIGLWAVLHENQVAFLRHPQLWLVPFALTGLIASHLNRDRLSRGQLASVRYAALSVIYVASTAETFLAGLGEDVVRPLVLIALSLAGVFAGMLMRVRAFLFLGAGFVALGVFALVWYAALQRAWVWYVAGIVLGIAIIVLFAIFEKRRDQLAHLLDRLREWE
jgi:hypothetical protein